MASLTIDAATKRFGPKTVLDRVSLAASDAEFVALLGPSGCGKSTLLRLIAGFEALDGGSIRIGGDLVSDKNTHVPTEDRRLGMVFQSYALWPHMTVQENISFALEVYGLDPATRKARVGQALETVGLTDLAARRPAELSGGQRQRVALARTLAAKPRVVLLDEPLANLDANLRETMQDEFRRFHRESAATMVFVTHDQAEALALADRVAVMMEGRLRQVDTPKALYDRPVDAEVARFIGRGTVVPVNCLDYEDGEAEVAIGDARLRLRAGPETGAGLAEASLRPEHCHVFPASTWTGDYADGIEARVRNVRFTGPSQLVTVELTVAAGTELLATASTNQSFAPGDLVRVIVEDGWLLPRASAAVAAA